MTREEMVAAIREEMARVSPTPQGAEEVMRRIGEGIGRARMNGHENGNGSKPRVDWTLNLPTMVTMLLAGAGFAATVFGYVGTLERRIQSIEQKDVIATERAAKYVPLIETAVARNDLQDAQNRVQEERIQNLAVGLQEVRKVNGEVMAVLGNIREDLAVIRERLQISRPQRQGEKR